MKDNIKPALWWLSLAPVLLLLCVGGGTALLLHKVLNPPAAATFVAPIIRTFEIDKPGTYVVSHDYNAEFNGIVYDKQRNLPRDTVIQLKGTRAEIPMQKSWGSGSGSRQEICRFKIIEPDNYTLSISGLQEPHLITFGESVLLGLITTAVICLALNLIGWFGSAALIIVILTERLKNKRLNRSLNKEKT